MHRITPKTSPRLKIRARQLRDESPIPERILWGLLRGRHLAGYKFRRQQVIGPYVTDYYCELARLVIELDGRSHDGRIAADTARDSYLRSRGLTVLRIPNDELLRNKAGVWETIQRILDELTGKPSPRPSPKGRGVKREKEDMETSK